MKLDEYQVEAKNDLLSHPRRILGDAAGLGKTYPSIKAASEAGGRTLIVCPSYLASMWEEKIRECEGEDSDVRVVKGTKKRKLDQIDAGGRWTIVSYDSLSRYLDLLASGWTSVIFDEAHYLRNRTNKRAKAAEKIESDNIWLLTGTPLYKDPSDAFQLLKMCDREKFRSYWDWAADWIKFRITSFGPQVKGVQNEQAFSELLDQYMLRRTFPDVGIELPPIYYQSMGVKLSDAAMKQMAEIKKDWRLSNPDMDNITLASAGSLLTHLRRISAIQPDGKSAKASLADNILKDSKGSKAIVYTWYRDSARRIASLSGREFFTVTGDVPDKKRDETIKAWRDSNDGVLAATIGCMKEGHNLQDASLGIFFEEALVGAVNQQAVARLHRRGQTQPVSIYCLHATGTVDERIHNTARGRSIVNSRALLEMALG